MPTEEYNFLFYDLNQSNFRQKDLEDRDAFHQRMIAKDKEKQRNIVTKSDKKAYEEAAKRLAQVNKRF